MSKRVTAWKIWVDLFTPLMDIAPEYFPLLCYEYPRFSWGKSNDDLVADPDPGTKTDSWQWATPVLKESDQTELRILFDPNSNRPNCIGSCRKIENELKKLSPESSCFYIQSMRKPVALLPEDCPVVFKDRFRLINPFRTINLITILLYHTWVLNRDLTAYFLRALPQILRSLVIIQSRIKEARRVLLENRINWFITPNEQGGLSSVFLVAARLEGIRVGQFLHGMPTRLYTPSFSDIFWIWGPATSRMLQEGARESFSEFIETGSLEFSGCVPSIENTKFNDPKDCHRLLVLSQIVGDDIWETSAYAASMKMIAEAVAPLDQWSVTIRLHPQAGINIKQKINSLLNASGCDYSFSTTSDLTEDVAKSDFVCTASSSGIIEALIQRKPLRLMWNHELDAIHRAPCFPDALLARSVAEFQTALLSANSNVKLYNEAFADFVGDASAPNTLASYLLSER